MANELFYVFDILNEQRDYAKCLEFIEILEGYKDNLKKDDQLSVIKSIVKEITINGCEAPKNKAAKRYYEIPLVTNDNIELVPLVNQVKRVQNPNIKDTILNFSGKNIYHLRIHLKYTSDGEIQNIMELRYLALLLQRLERLINEKNAAASRISVFIVPASAPEYPFINLNGTADTATYQMISEYFRLISSAYTGTIYGLDIKANDLMVQALNFKSAPRFSKYFPLTPINQETYEKLFNDSISQEDLDLLFGVKNGRKRFRNAANARPNMAFVDYLLEASASALMLACGTMNEDSRCIVIQLVKEAFSHEGTSNETGTSLLTFALFCFTFSSILPNALSNRTQEDFKQGIKNNYRRAVDLAEGLRQIAQNTLQHSPTKSGIFTFSVQLKEGKQNIQLALCDYNNVATFSQSFLKNLNRERELLKKADPCDLLPSGRIAAYDGLIDQGENILLKDFFIEHNGSSEAEKAWDVFRKADSYAHVGLLLFQNAVARYKGSISVANSSTGNLSKKSLYFHNFGESSEGANYIKQDSIIPGTHFFINIPNLPAASFETQELLGLAQFNHIHEGYFDFALYLPFHYQYCTLPVMKMNPKSTTFSAHEKLVAVSNWRKAWIFSATKAIEEAKNSVNSKKIIFVWDMRAQHYENLTATDMIEVFWKGFAEALDLFGVEDTFRREEFLHIAIINLSRTQIAVFRKLCQTYILKSFPSRMQVYISQVLDYENNKNRLNHNSFTAFHLIGDTYAQAMQNAYCLAIERGTCSFDHYELEQISIMKKNSTTSPNTTTLFTPRDISICPFDSILPWRMAPTQVDNSSEEDWSLPTLFDRQIELMAESPIDEPPHGYKITDTHMQLGNKIHIHAFYEMAFLFYRTSIANRIAFEILRELNKNRSKVDLLKDKFLFYGYASYSKALLTSIVEILKFYRTICKNTSTGTTHSLDIDEEVVQTLAIAAYQHNLQSESKLPKVDALEEHHKRSAISEKTQLYFDFPETNTNLKGEDEKERIRSFFGSPVKLIQIVPISSTLTTFCKMYTRLCRELLEIKSKAPLDMQLIANHTAFWVADQPKRIGNGHLSNIEQKYIAYAIADSEDSLIKNRIVKAKSDELSENPQVHFLMMAAATWEMPLKCEKCFPKNPIAEVPLVSVDQTSTVPTQQLRIKEENATNCADQEENNKRLLYLYQCIWKGHILREKNHFNYYIDTQKFFSLVRYKVAKWLTKLAEAAPQVQMNPLNIIFSPEHPTNIGFAQYVNNYYFKGNAEIVCLNEDKEFRSNFCCEHMALLQAISHVFALNQESEIRDIKELPVKFYFVDDTIISGTTFHKANSFLHTLLPYKVKDRYPTNLINKCFVLVDRLSDASKRNYVKDIESDFHSFVHLDISNSRIQGDSCVGCKRVQSAVHLFKRSATRLHALYWFQEINRNAICTYDDTDSYEKTVQNNPDWEHAGRKALLSHLSQNIIFKENAFFEPGAICDSVLEILTRLLHLNRKNTQPNTFRYQILIDEISKQAEPQQLVTEFFQLVSMPFFSYDFKCRLQIQTILIVFSECLLNGVEYVQNRLPEMEIDPEFEKNYKKFLFQNGRFERILKIYQGLDKNLCKESNKLFFLDKCLLFCLAELQSNYLIRKTTFSGIYNFIQNTNCSDVQFVYQFFEHYAAYIHHLLDSGSDDTRSLWLEHLLTKGEEYSEFESSADDQMLQPLYEVIHREGKEDAPDLPFSQFFDEILLQNICIIYNSIENAVIPSSETVYSMENYKEFRKIDYVRETIYESEKALYKTLQKCKKESKETLDVKKKYENILQNIKRIAIEKYQFSNVKIALLTCSEKDIGSNRNLQDYEIQQLDFVASGNTVPIKESWMRYNIKTKLLNALNHKSSMDGKCPLLKYGYQISPQKGSSAEKENPYLLIYFDNPDDPVSPSVTISVGTAVGREVKRIVKVFLYFSAQVCGNEKRDKTNSAVADIYPESLTLRLFLRDILMHRHNLMKILENDFAGDTFAKYAHTSNERKILTHEKVNSHSTSSDDRASLEVLALPKNVARYEVLDSGQVLRWLLLRNYTNGQIAKLFNRSFSKRDEDGLFDRGDSSINLPPLYISGDKNLGSYLDRPLQEFYQLGIMDDARFILLEQAVSIQYNEDLNDAKFICNEKGEYYNAEYMRCVLIDSMFSAMKYFADREGFLPRLDHCLKRMHHYRHPSMNCAMESIGSIDKNCSDQSVCTVTLERKDNAQTEKFDYLVITNTVNYSAHNLFDWKSRNLQIKAHLNSPTDFFDGQMSLLAIKEYIEGLFDSHPGKTAEMAEFKYIAEMDSTTGNIIEMKFESKLPILKKKQGGKQV